MALRWGRRFGGIERHLLRGQRPEFVRAGQGHVHFEFPFVAVNAKEHVLSGREQVERLDQLAEVDRKYKLGVPARNLCELVADAIVWPPEDH